MFDKNIDHLYYFYQTDRDLALIPYYIKKEIAVKYVIEEYYSTDILTIGLGDHQNDLDFMQICDFVCFPSDSMLNGLMQKFSKNQK